MKKLYFTFIIFVFCGFLISGGSDIQEEAGYLLFMPNSGNQFENEEQAFIQLDNLAQYLMNKNLIPGKILVNGYAAYAPNNIEPVDLSRERAVFVMNELQKRGVSKELFSEPAGYGSVYLWGSNIDENDRRLNRRVSILVEGEFPVTIPETIDAGQKTIIPVKKAGNYHSNFLFRVLFLLAVFLILFLILLKEISRRPAHKNTKTNTKSASSAASFTVNLDEQIRSRAYEISQQRKEQGDFRDQDWYNAAREISAWYTVRNYSVFTDGGSWWAYRAYSN